MAIFPLKFRCPESTRQRVECSRRTFRVHATPAAVSYQYNSAGQRLFKTDTRLSTTTPVTEQTLYAEDDTGSTVIGQYANRRSANSAAAAGDMDSTEVLYLPTASGPMPVATQINGRLYAINADHLNTPRRLTNTQGQVAWQWLISGFGEVQPTTGATGYALNGIPSSKVYSEAVSFKLRYPGQVWDEETGLAYNLHRYYDAQVGRYVQADPIGLDGGWNRYSYVGGNPLSFVDPMGLDRWGGTSANYRYTPTAGAPVNAATSSALTCFSICVGGATPGPGVTVTAGQEGGHSKGSAHETGAACDVGKNSNPDLTRAKTEQCFQQCFPASSSWGQEEGNHFHMQTRPGSSGGTGFIPGVH